MCSSEVVNNIYDILTPPRRIRLGIGRPIQRKAFFHGPHINEPLNILYISCITIDLYFNSRINEKSIKVLSIASYEVSPSFRQCMEYLPKLKPADLLRLGTNQVINRFSNMSSSFAMLQNHFFLNFSIAFCNSFIRS